MRFGIEPLKAPSTLPEAVKRVLSLDCASAPEVKKARISRAIEAFQSGPGDTGSSACQIAAISVRIEALKAHTLVNRKDNASKRGLNMMMNKRRSLLKVLINKKIHPWICLMS